MYLNPLYAKIIYQVSEVSIMEKYILSQINRKNFSKATNEIYLLTDYNHKQYQEYLKWYYTKNIPRVLNGTGEIIFYLDGLTVAGLAILKKDPDEAKICTLMITEEYRKNGYSKELLESSFEFLGTDKPLITIPSNRIEEFQGIITSYNWQETEKTDIYLSQEIIFNSPKKLTRKPF